MSAATMVRKAKVAADITADEAYALFDEMAGSPEGPVDVEAMRAISVRYGDEPRMKSFLQEWFFDKRGMTPKHTPLVMGQLAANPEDRRRIRDLVNARLTGTSL